MIWPDIPFKKCDFILERNVMAFTSSFNSASQQADLGGSFWRAEVELAWLSRAQSSEMLGLLARYGRSGFLLPDAPHATPFGTGGGEPVTVGSNQGGLVNVAGATPNRPGWLKAGDRVQIGNHLYLLSRDANTDAGGRTTLSIMPYLRTAPVAGTVIRTHGCACLMQLDASETLGRLVSPGKRYLASMTLKLTEVIG